MKKNIMFFCCLSIFLALISCVKTQKIKVVNRDYKDIKDQKLIVDNKEKNNFSKCQKLALFQNNNDLLVDDSNIASKNEIIIYNKECQFVNKIVNVKELANNYIFFGNSIYISVILNEHLHESDNARVYRINEKDLELIMKTDKLVTDFTLQGYNLLFTAKAKDSKEKNIYNYDVNSQTIQQIKHGSTNKEINSVVINNNELIVLTLAPDLVFNRYDTSDFQLENSKISSADKFYLINDLDRRYLANIASYDDIIILNDIDSLKCSSHLKWCQTSKFTNEIILSNNYSLLMTKTNEVSQNIYLYNRIEDSKQKIIAEVIICDAIIMDNKLYLLIKTALDKEVLIFTIK